MSALTSTLRLELRLQRRYGFLYAAVFSGLLWLGILLPFPLALREIAAPYVIFGDLVVVGYFFIAGSLFFEKGERTVFALVVTPMSFRAYLTAKVASLTALSTALALVIVLVAFGSRFDPVALLVGAVLATVLFLLVSFVTSTAYATITDWMIPSTLWIGVLSLPMLHLSGLWQHPVLYLVPSHGSLLLLGSAFGQIELAAWEWGYAVGYQLLWVGILGVLARVMFDRHIVAGEGKSS